MSAELICVNPKDIDEILPNIASLLDRALKRGDGLTKERTLSELRAGTFLLWLAASDHVEALAVTQLSAEDKSCVVVLCAGNDRKRWVHFIALLENYARNEGCKAMTIHARKGWMRVLPDYRLSRVILKKEL